MSVNAFEYIYDENEVTCYDKYFKYLASISTEMPAKCREFFCNTDIYQLTGNQTLHDAWIEEINVVNKYMDNSLISKVELLFLLASHNSKLKLCYEGITSMSYVNQPSFWADKATDLLHHEFSIKDGKLSHVMQFDRDVWFSIEFQKFNFKYY